MVIIVPTFAKGNQSAPAHIMSLYGRAIDNPVLMTLIMREVTDEPMAED